MPPDEFIITPGSIWNDLLPAPKYKSGLKTTVFRDNPLMTKCQNDAFDDTKRASDDQSAALLDQFRVPLQGAAAKPGTMAPLDPLDAEPKELSAEQQRVLHRAVNLGENIFYTGSAGTGKSLLLREIIQKMRIKHNHRGQHDQFVAVTASTGMAAYNIGGTTIHSFAGVGTGTQTAEKYMKQLPNDKRLIWRKTRVLIIDEVSMISGQLFDLLERLARLLRHKDAPFGGIQVIATGDFLQLPPIGANCAFAFEAKSWKQTFGNNCIELKHVFRQSDPEFIKILNQMRVGRLSAESISKLKQCMGRKNLSQHAPFLYPLKEQVSKMNNMALEATEKQFNQKRRKFQAKKHNVNNFDRLPFNVPETLELVVGCRVILLKNLAPGLVNGSIGNVVGFIGTAPYDDEKVARPVCYLPNNKGVPPIDRFASCKADGAPVVEFRDGKRYAFCAERWTFETPRDNRPEVTQIPLTLAWALSIHKSQGQTLAEVSVDLAGSFADGQAYVAVSRATSLDKLCIISFDQKKVTANRKVLKFYDTLKSQ